jgi:hypothetical protein
MTLYIFFDRIDEFKSTNNVIRMECQLSIYWRKSKMTYRFEYIILLIFKEVNKVMKFHVEFSDKKIKLKHEN